MKNRWLINIILVVIVAILATIILYKPGKDSSSKTSPLTKLLTEKITNIKISRAHLADISLKKLNGGWQLIKPFSARANEYNVNAVLQIAGAAVEPGFEATGHELEKFGLKKPATVILLDDHKISIGRQHPLKNARYALTDNTIYVLPVHEMRIAENSENDFIDSRLLNKGFRLTEISLPKLKLAEKDGQWKALLDKNSFNPLTRDKINDFIIEWENARALTVMKYTGRQPVSEIKIKYKHTTNKINKIKLGILAYEPELVLYRKDEGLEYHFPQEAGKRLLQPQLNGKRDTQNK